MFSQACVKNSVHGGEGGGISVPACTTGHMFRGRSLSRGAPVRENPLYGNDRTVCILMECILVYSAYCTFIVQYYF